MGKANWREGIRGELLDAVQSQRFGLISDLDGTLSPIVDIPDEARISQRNEELLQALTPHLELLAIISGRGVSDLGKRVALPKAVLIGNHGNERKIGKAIKANPEASAFRENIRALEGDLKDFVGPGIELENKDFNLALHYRRAEDGEGFANMHKGNLAKLAEKHELVFSQGRKVFEFKAPVQVNKGSALRELYQEYDLEAILFLGDDTTDIAALDECRNLREIEGRRCFGIAVKSAEGDPAVVEAADFSAENVQDVEDLLAWLLEARKASST